MLFVATALLLFACGARAVQMNSGDLSALGSLLDAMKCEETQVSCAGTVLHSNVYKCHKIVHQSSFSSVSSNFIYLFYWRGMYLFYYFYYCCLVLLLLLFFCLNGSTFFRFQGRNNHWL